MKPSTRRDERQARGARTTPMGLALAAFMGLATTVSPARAQGASDASNAAAARQTKQQQSVLQIGEITIVGRVQKPIAAVDVAKIQPRLTLAELRQPFLDRIEAAVRKDPF
jgi:hypothetical protein